MSPEPFAFVATGNKTSVGTHIIRALLVVATIASIYFSFFYTPSSEKPAPKPVAAPAATASPAPPSTPATK
jgi:hypothetical protein